MPVPLKIVVKSQVFREVSYVKFVFDQKNINNM